MKAGLAQINTTVGDLEGNCSLISEAYRSLCAAGAEIVVFPELAVCGYPPRDLVFKTRFVKDAWAATEQLAGSIGKIPAVFGTLIANDSGRGRRVFNGAVYCRNGKILALARKTLLPTYDVFDEDRYFESAPGPAVVEDLGRRIGITICEDIWTGPVVETSRHYDKDPVAQLAGKGVDLVINLSASPWQSGKTGIRTGIVGRVSQLAKAPCIYCNAVGGNDELIFDGHSMVSAADGTLLAGLSGFRPENAVVDLASKTPALSPRFNLDASEEIFDALVLGLRDYAHKSGFRKAVLGLSGGIDSALTAAIAAEALGPENVIGISLPSAISSDHSKSDAAALAKNLSIRYETIAIAGIVSATEAALTDVFAGTARDVAEENIQARARGLLLMAVSNKFGALLLTTGNKSEVSVGYCTLYGDMAGGLAVISDLFKMQVYELSRWINRNREIIPWNSIEKPPSAELRPNQTDQDSLPPYPVLDEILRRYVELGQSSAEIVEATGYDGAVVRDIVRKVDRNEYKRKQAAPGLKISPLAFGVGRRIPIVQKYVP
ncbi:MAG TPA: NAD+ synthase [Opitutales bacterium]|nr:NAD+ synthase [Opitutales bacterium]